MRSVRWNFIFCAVALYGVGTFLSAWYIENFKVWLLGSVIQVFSAIWVVYELFLRGSKR